MCLFKKKTKEKIKQLQNQIKILQKNYIELNKIILRTKRIVENNKSGEIVIKTYDATYTSHEFIKVYKDNQEYTILYCSINENEIKSIKQDETDEHIIKVLVDEQVDHDTYKKYTYIINLKTLQYIKISTE